MSNEDMREKIVREFDKNQVAFEAMLDQIIAEVRHNTSKSHRAESITQCAMSFSDSDSMDDALKQGASLFGVELPTDLTNEIHSVFVAYLYSLVVHRLIWPSDE